MASSENGELKSAYDFSCGVLADYTIYKATTDRATQAEKLAKLREMIEEGINKALRQQAKVLTKHYFERSKW